MLKSNIIKFLPARKLSYWQS